MPTHTRFQALGLPTLLLFALSLNPAFASLDDHFDRLTTRVKDAVHSTDIGGDVDLIELEAGDFAKLGVNAAVEVSQNQDKVTYSRSEKLEFAKALKFQTPGPVFLQSEISKGSEVEFIRQFDSQIDALNLVKTPPYSPRRIPTTGYKALDLKEGDYVRFQSRMALSVGAGVGHEMGIFRVSGARRYIVYGDFQIEVFRKADQKVGLRLSSLQKNSWNTGVNLGHGYALDVFAVVGLGEASQNAIKDKLNEVITDKLLPTTIVGVNAVSAKGSLLSLEYEYTLDNILSIEAFEKIVNPLNWEFRKHVSVQDGKIYPGKNLLTVNTQETEALVGTVILEGPIVRSVFKGESQFSEKTRGLNINLPLITRKRGFSFLEQDFKFQNEAKERTYLKLAQLTLKNSISALLGVLGRKQEREANILFETDPDGNVTDFHELNFSYSREEKTHLSTERRRVQGQVYRMLPEKYHSAFNLGQVAGGLLERDVNIYVHSTIHKQAFHYVAQLTERDIEDVVNNLFDVIGADQSKAPFNNRYGIFHVNQPNPSNGEARRWRDRAEPYRAEFIAALQEALLNSTDLDPNERWEKLKELSQNRFFRQLGSGVFIRIVEYAARKFRVDFETLAAFELRLNSGSGQSLSKTLGSPEKSEIMRKVLTARDRILGRKLNRVYW